MLYKTVPEGYVHPVLTYFAGIMLGYKCYLVEAEHIVRDELLHATVLDWKVLGQELRLPQEILIGIDYDNQRLEHKRKETIRTWFDSEESPVGKLW